MNELASRTSGEASPAARKVAPVVGIGASAGALEAFSRLLRALPADTGLAFVLVQHLEPGHQRIGAKLLARAADMPVHEVRDGMRAKPNHVYVAPAQAHLSLMGELFQIVGRKAPAKHDRPIDCFFNSLAKTRKSQAIGVILSGAGSDGTAGLKSIKDEGGITLAQEPASAKFDGMPRSAIAAGCVDLILPPERIAAELARAAHPLFVAESVAALPAKRESAKHAGRAARRSDLSNGLGRVASAANLPIVILDRDRRIRLFSLPAQKLLGLFTGDIGRPMGKLHGVNIPDLKELISAVIEHGEEVGREVQSEEGRWYWLRITPFRTGEKKIEGVLILFVNIHALKQTQEALQKERNLISTTLGAAKDLLVVVMDREGRIVQFNRVCQQLTGYTAEEVKGRRPWDFLLLTEETPAVRRIFKELVGGTPNQKENHWVTKDGRRLLISWSNSAVISEGSVEFVIATGIDQTARVEARQRAEESEATVRALLETATQAILAINRQRQIVLANAAAEKMFGYSREELIGQPLRKLVPERLRESHKADLIEWFLHPRIRAIGRELPGLRKDGTEFPVNISLSHIESGGEVLGVAFVSDITKPKKDEEALLEYHKQLQRLSGSLISVQETENRELARELHDVYSQELAALAMEISTLLNSPEIEGPLTQRLADLGKKLGDLADDMHRTSRQLHPAILHELGVETALREECDALSEQCGIPVQFLCEGLTAWLSEDVSLCLYRIAQETLRNIRKHTTAAEVQVRLRGEGGGISLRVEDTGNGFDVEEARKSGGLGLLSMEERVRLVNGRFAIRSSLGTGTTVEVFVPLDEKGP